jgi:hypothetical protein
MLVDDHTKYGAECSTFVSGVSHKLCASYHRTIKRVIDDVKPCLLVKIAPMKDLHVRRSDPAQIKFSLGNGIGAEAEPPPCVKFLNLLLEQRYPSMPRCL